MHQMTITEALAEVRLIEKKIEKGKQMVGQHVARFDHVIDPFEEQGGSRMVVTRELQSLHDLGERRVKIREALSEANLKTMLAIGTTTRSITGWLAWKREVAESEQRVMVQLVSQAQQHIERAQSKPTVYKEKDGEEPKLAKLILNVDISDLNAKAMAIEEILGVLDGKLSLLNATTVINVPE